jgi:transposase-like protein
MEFESLVNLLKVFNSEKKCIDSLANIRWGNNPVCPRCKSGARINRLKVKQLWWCGNCKRQFSVKVGTIFEGSKIKLQKWFIAIWLLVNHKKGISSCQLARDLGVTQKTAWFMLGRLREVLPLLNDNNELFGIVEVDETYIGGKEKNKHGSKRIKNTQGRSQKTKDVVVGMIERDGKVKTYHVSALNRESVKIIVSNNIKIGSHIMTDEYKVYKRLNESGYIHKTINHSVKEYVKGKVHTNTIENVWSLFKRSIYGIYHNVSSKHLQRYLNEFTGRINTRYLTDCSRIKKVLSHTSGLRLTYKRLIHENYI